MHHTECILKIELECFLYVVLVCRSSPRLQQNKCFPKTDTAKLLLAMHHNVRLLVSAVTACYSLS